MSETKRGVGFLLAVVVISTAAVAQGGRRELHYSVSPGATITIIGEAGPVTVRPASGMQVLISAVPRSDKVEVDGNKMGNRIEVRSHRLQPRASAEEARVDYDVQVPADAVITVHTSTGQITVDRLAGDVTLESDTGKVQIRDCAGAHLHVKTLDGPVTLGNLKGSYIDVTSTGGDVAMTNISGPKVSINTGKGKITYDGDFIGGGDYSFTNHSGDIEVTMPASASVDVMARSVTGSVEDGFQFQPQKHAAFATTQGKSFAGTSNTGDSSVKLRSFSGKIKVKKR